MASATPKLVIYKIKWIIKNVTREKIKEDDDYSLSIFTSNTETIQTSVGNRLIKWCLEVYYNSYSLGVSFNLKEIDSEVSMSLRVKMHNYEKTLEANLRNDDINAEIGWEDFIHFNKLFNQVNQYIDHNKSLTLDVEVKFTEIMSDVDMSHAYWIPFDPYSQYFNNNTFSDFKFKCSDGVEIPVHRFCLAAHSEVFMKMFTVDMEEKNSNLVVFKDISSVTMKTALKFIYTKEFCFTDLASTIKVLDVSEKYEFLKLKQHCIDQLMTHADAENVLEIFEAADLYNVRFLEVKCLSIIYENYEDIKRTENYDMLEKPLVQKISQFINSVEVKNISIETSMSYS